MEKKETVLVTGGTGFVGAQIVLQLLQKGISGQNHTSQVLGIDQDIPTPVNRWCLTFHPDILQGDDLGKKKIIIFFLHCKRSTYSFRR